MTEPRCTIPAFVNINADDADAAARALIDVGAGRFDVQRVDPSTLKDHVRRAVSTGATRLVVAGGDGTIGTTADVIVGSGIELAILPAGTLNHLAKDLGLTEDLERAVSDAVSGTTKAIDVGVVNDRIFLNTSSVGAYVIFVRVRERWRPRVGYWVASIIAALRILTSLPKYRVVVDVEGVRREYLTPLVFVGVGERELRLPTLGARIPGGRRGLHVMVVRSSTGARLVALALAAAAKGVRAVSRTPHLDAFFVDRCSIEPRRGTKVGSIAVDGEIVAAFPPLRYELVRDGLMVVVGQAD